MKLYKITAGINHPVVNLSVPTIQINESKDGKWVKYEEVHAVLQSILGIVCGSIAEKVLEEKMK